MSFTRIDRLYARQIVLHRHIRGRNLTSIELIELNAAIAAFDAGTPKRESQLQHVRALIDEYEHKPTR